MKNFYFRIPATLICCNIQTRRRRRRRVIIIFLQSFMTWSQSRRFDWNTADTSSEMQRTQPNECEVMDVVLFFPSVTAAAISVASKQKTKNGKLKFIFPPFLVSFLLMGLVTSCVWFPLYRPSTNLSLILVCVCVCDNHNRTRQLVSTYRPAQVSLSEKMPLVCIFYFISITGGENENIILTSIWIVSLIPFRFPSSLWWTDAAAFAGGPWWWLMGSLRRMYNKTRWWPQTATVLQLSIAIELTRFWLRLRLGIYIYIQRLCNIPWWNDGLYKKFRFIYLFIYFFFWTK